jgi:hypothetical protein
MKTDMECVWTTVLVLTVLLGLPALVALALTVIANGLERSQRAAMAECKCQHPTQEVAR